MFNWIIDRIRTVSSKRIDVERRVLELMSDGRERHGLEVVRSLPNGTSRNLVYSSLTRLTASSQLSSRDETWAERPEKGPRRVYYRINGTRQDVESPASDCAQLRPS